MLLLLLSSPPQEVGKNFKTLGVGWAWETLRGVGHGTKTTYNAVSGVVGLQTAQRELQQQMAAGPLTPQQGCCGGGWVGVGGCGWGGGGGGGAGGAAAMAKPIQSAHVWWQHCLLTALLSNHVA